MPGLWDQNQTSESWIDPNDIANGFYPHLRKVGPDNPEFLDVLAWLTSRGAPAAAKIRAQRALTANGPGRWLPAELTYESAQGSVVFDAALVFNFPHITLVELKNYFHFGDASVWETYPGPRHPAAYVTLSPIGAAWPEQGDNCFRPAPTDRYDYGAEYVDPTGRYRKERRMWAFFALGVWVKVV
jgi:hypothetical protein